ncbi:hypothetical protein BP5796_00168 [Coleophoma crateriformis]|uniref:Uncharacterized protein n=1 Tax=Coleophoma crateriformis TaxID=565419 RepID=A0A3D8T776_9HELO|nr:hypothetical protein BP5796_00168 [Coleophoma crateriformis]
MASNLLSAGGDLQLAPELCLMIFEYLEYTPELMSTLRTLSKSFYALLQAHQNILCKKFARKIVAHSCTRSDVRISIGACARCIHCIARAQFLRDGFEKQRFSVLDRSILPSSPYAFQSPRTILYPNTFAWLSELYLRNEQTQELVLGQDTTEASQAYISLYSSAAPGFFVSPIILLRLSRLKAVAIDFLFELVDRTAGLSEQHAIRRAQEEFLYELNPTQLALLGTMLHLFSEGYKKAPTPSSECTPEQRISVEVSAEEARLQREEQIIFSDRILRRGPFFAYAYHLTCNSSAQISLLGTDKWVASEIKDGLRELKAYEEDSDDGVAGLQSCLSRAFCEKTGCSPDERWREMLESLEGMLRLDL